MKRVTKDISRELITFVKKVDVHANLYNENSVAAYEFWRQMSGPKLKKNNPTFECTFHEISADEFPVVKVEFVDGKQWQKVASTGVKAADIRNELFTIAEMTGDAIELNDGEEGESTEDDDDEMPTSQSSAKVALEKASSEETKRGSNKKK